MEDVNSLVGGTHEFHENGAPHEINTMIAQLMKDLRSPPTVSGDSSTCPAVFGYWGVCC